jgi:hypothetical protein
MTMEEKRIDQGKKIPHLPREGRREGREGAIQFQPHTVRLTV